MGGALATRNAGLARCCADGAGAALRKLAVLPLLHVFGTVEGVAALELQTSTRKIFPFAEAFSERFARRYQTWL
eukprot:5224270-Pyramimonas_sp.AAC.1